MENLPTVMIVGRQSVVREGLCKILSQHEFAIVQSVTEISLLIERTPPSDILIFLDGDCAHAERLAINTLRTRFPSPKLVMLNDAFDLDTVVSAFQAGVFGYLIQEISSDSLVASLRLIAMGEKVLPIALMNALPRIGASDQQDAGRRLLEGARLSVREREILACLIAGHSDKVIAAELAISVATVKVHVKAILRKMHVHNRTQAAIQGVNGGMNGYPAGPPSLDSPTAALS